MSVSWGLSVGSLGTWGVLQVMSQFPKCFTLGEAITVTHGIVLFLLSSGTNFPLRYHLPPLHDDDIATAILQVRKLFYDLMLNRIINFKTIYSISGWHHFRWIIMYILCILSKNSYN